MSKLMLPGRAPLFAGKMMLAVTLAVAVAGSGYSVFAQGRGGAPAGPPPSAWASAAIDLTGYWVSVVNEDWRWRMVTPPKGDYASVPMTDEARKVADTWDVSKDGQCEAYGAAALMRMPTRVHITWENDNTLKVETDAGQQTRRFTFDRTAQPTGGRSLQGFSKAEWERPAGAGRGQVAPGGNLKVVTTNLRAGWLRKNGVPYSENATVTEYYDRFTAPNGDNWFTVTTIVDDPQYLNQPFVTSSHFKKEPDGSKWAPSPCKGTT
jgi:hypothetical protein